MSLKIIQKYFFYWNLSGVIQESSFEFILHNVISLGRNKFLLFETGVHYTLRIFPPAIDIIPTLLAVVYSNGKYTN